MNSLDAAYQILADAGAPLHSAEIARRMLDQGLWKSAGKTPGATVDARIAVDIKANGAGSRFQRVGRSTFTTNGNGIPPSVPPPNDTAVPKPTMVSPSTPPLRTAAQPLSFVDAAERVLEKFAHQQPMHYQEITKRALDLGLIATAGQTPAATMYAVILTEIDKLTKRSEQPRFTKHGKGMVGLAKWSGQDRGLAALIDQHNRATRAQLHTRLHTMRPAEFEALIGRLLTTIGFDAVEVTVSSGDGGIDVRGTLVVGDVIRTRLAVQVKRWKKNVQAPTVQQVRGSLGAHEQGLIITTSDFSAGARAEAARSDATPVALMHGEQLVTLLIEHDIGVRRTKHDLIAIGDADDG
ncbi:MAG: restriction endonuclease [Kouleothrix sp.]|nr:restriction endonuclease [Kouleothrix sp.]